MVNAHRRHEKSESCFAALALIFCVPPRQSHTQANRPERIRQHKGQRFLISFKRANGRLKHNCHSKVCTFGSCFTLTRSVSAHRARREG